MSWLCHFSSIIDHSKSGINAKYIAKAIKSKEEIISKMPSIPEKNIKKKSSEIEQSIFWPLLQNCLANLGKSPLKII